MNRCTCAEAWLQLIVGIETISNNLQEKRLFLEKEERGYHLRIWDDSFFSQKLHGLA